MGHWLQTGCFAKGGFRSTLQSGTYKLPNSVRLVSSKFLPFPNLCPIPPLELSPPPTSTGSPTPSPTFPLSVGKIKN